MSIHMNITLLEWKVGLWRIVYLRHQMILILWIMNMWSVIFTIYSDACLIDEEGDSFLLIGGGMFASARTSRYSIDSWLEDLDDLNIAQQEHACGWYTDTEGKRVRYIWIINTLFMKQAENGLQSRSLENDNHGLSRTIMDCHIGYISNIDQ